MGEAKRRKALDESWGKPPFSIQVGDKDDLNDWQREQIEHFKSLKLGPDQCHHNFVLQASAAATCGGLWPATITLASDKQRYPALFFLVTHQEGSVTAQAIMPDSAPYIEQGVMDSICKTLAEFILDNVADPVIFANLLPDGARSSSEQQLASSMARQLVEYAVEQRLV